MDVERFLDQLIHSRDFRDQMVHVETIPARAAAWGELEQPLAEPLPELLARQGIERLYTHQAESIAGVRRGENVVVVTGTASGKTLCYNLPVLEHMLSDPKARALYLYPTKALAQDQLRGLLRFRELGLKFEAGTYDGDTPTSTRAKIRDKAHFILTNPDMLHSGILPNHSKWAEFFTHLRYVVIDEVHTYRGIFGSNVGNVIRRLLRICQHYESKPQFICASATIGNPQELVQALIGQPATVVDRDGAPRGPKRFVFWNPPVLDRNSMERGSPNIEAERLMARLIENGVQTITFVRARVLAELIYRYCRDALLKSAPSLAHTIRAYRGGYLPSERREIEQQLFNGELLGVTSTSALELGIDIGGLDACIIVGYPGSIASTWQRAGRAGRGDEESLVVLVGHNNPLDQYLMRHPEYVFGQSHEQAVIDPDNPHIVVGHLRCAANELPLTNDDLNAFGEYAPAVAGILEDNGQITRRGDRWYWSHRGYPAADIGLRNMADNTYTIVDAGDESRVIGTIDEFGAFTQVHDQAIYMHRGETYFVRELDLEKKMAYIEKTDVDYYTQSVTEPSIRVDELETQRTWRISEVCLGDVTVTQTTIMFKKIKFRSLDSIGFGNLDLPPQELETVAMWLIPSSSSLQRVRDFQRSPGDGMLGIANVAGHVVPLFALCDSRDFGSVVDSSNTGVPTLFIYDRYPGGLGFAQRCYDVIEDIMRAARERIAECPCEDGCPSCVGVATDVYAAEALDARDRMPDKEAALVLLHDMLELEPYTPPPVRVPSLVGEPGQAEPDQRPVKRLPGSVETKIRDRVRSMTQHRRSGGPPSRSGGGDD